jgi:DNA polymerase III epsilon subunit-like protein
MDKILLLDCETTGVKNHPIHGHPQVIELAYIDLTEIKLSSLTEAMVWTLPVVEQRFRPSMAIHPEAYKIHGISSRDLENCPKSETLTLPPIQYVLGHNIKYDKRCMNKKEIPEICTLDLAKTVSKNFNIKYDNHKLDTLVNHYYPDHAHKLVTPLHSASGDVVKNLLVLLKLVEHLRGIKTWDDLYDIQQDIKKVRR